MWYCPCAWASCDDQCSCKFIPYLVKVPQSLDRSRTVRRALRTRCKDLVQRHARLVQSHALRYRNNMYQGSRFTILTTFSQGYVHLVQGHAVRGRCQFQGMEFPLSTPDNEMTTHIPSLRMRLEPVE